MYKFYMMEGKMSTYTNFTDEQLSVANSVKLVSID